MTYHSTGKLSTISQNDHKRDHDYQIHLNFVPIDGEIPDFTIYRRKQVSSQEARPGEDIMAYSLPARFGEEDDWQSYWVSIENETGFESIQIPANLNPYLTQKVLFWSIKTSASKILPPEQYWIPNNHFINELAFIQRIHDEGHEELIVQPYFLRSIKQFGFLVDFHFKLRDGVPFSRRIQQLSLTLDKNYRRNLDYYLDRFSKIRTFLTECQKVLCALPLPGNTDTIQITNEFIALPATRLKTKVYLFAGNRESKSQFTGLREHGPLKPLQSSLKFLFVFREQDRQAARRLAMNLRGLKSANRFSFPGFDALFKCDPIIDNQPVVLTDLNQSSIENALNRVKQEMEIEETIVPIFVLPEDDNSYLIQKSLFSHAEIATQVCTISILRDENTLKWAIANIALQIFCKAGGYPWKVRPTEERSLIIGISQSHKLREANGRRFVERYFAFSVMTDNSGLFQKIQVLGQGQESGNYIRALRHNLREVLMQSAQEFSRVVIHTSFKLKRSEIDAIQETVIEAAKDSSCRFAVVKVNQKSRFFGTNRDVNSLVPYEATKVKLGPREYLVWFEGIFPDKTTVNKVFPGPTHLQILRISDEQNISDEVLLQDLVNLSGANWRGFNAKSSPVSVFYCHLVADLVHDFHEQNLPLPAIKDIKPWFL